MRVLLTGATGFLGNNILRILLEQGINVTAVVRTNSELRPLDGLDVETVYGDLSRPGITGDLHVPQVLEGVDGVINSAAIIQLGWTKMELSMRVNRDATAELASACQRRGIRMVHISTVDALAAASSSNGLNDETDVDPPKSEGTYTVTKRAGDVAFLQAVENGLDGVLVHPGFMLGPWDWKPSSGEMILALAKFRVPFAPAGGFSVADVRDVAEGVISALKNGRTGERYILGGENMPYLELWQRIANIISAKPPKRKLPNWLAWTVGKFGDLSARFSGNESNVNSAAIAMGQLFHYYTSEKAERELGYRIGSVEDAIADAWEWFKAYGYV